MGWLGLRPRNGSLLAFSLIIVGFGMSAVLLVTEINKRGVPATNFIFALAPLTAELGECGWSQVCGQLRALILALVLSTILSGTTAAQNMAKRNFRADDKPPVHEESASA